MTTQLKEGKEDLLPNYNRFISALKCPLRKYIPSKPGRYGIIPLELVDLHRKNWRRTRKKSRRKCGKEIDKGHRKIWTIYNLRPFLLLHIHLQLMYYKQLIIIGSIRKNRPDFPRNPRNRDILST